MTVAAILAALALHAPIPAVAVNVQECPVPPAGTACALPGAVYVPRDMLNPFNVAHELGHEWDFAHLTDADHARLAPLLGGPGAWFWQTDADMAAAAFNPDAAPPGERFADAYALCAIGSKRRRAHHSDWVDGRLVAYVGSYGETFKPVVIARICWLIHRR